MASVGQYLQPLLLQSVFGGGASQSQWTGAATVYLGVTMCQAATSVAWTTSVTDANLKAGEPTSTGGYARIAVTNNTTNFPVATGSNPATSKLHVAFSFPISTGSGWSTGAQTLTGFFVADALTLGGGNILWSGALSPSTDVVNGSGITFTFAIDALQFTLS